MFRLSLDTVPDLVAYLIEKERFLTKPGRLITVSGEEDLIARYQMTFRDGKHSLPEIPEQHDLVAFVEGDWKDYSLSPQRQEKKRVDASSTLWDGLIEYQSKFVRAGTAIGLPRTSPTEIDHERVLRALAEESRFSRRKLSADLLYALGQSRPGSKFARVSFSINCPTRAYVFLTIPRPTGMQYDEYRESRSTVLLTYCHAVKFKFPHATEVVGIGTEPFSDGEASHEFVYVDLDFEVDDEHIEFWTDAMEEMGVFQSELTVRHQRDWEFPLQSDFTGEGREISVDGSVLNRKARRAAAARARSRRR